MKLFIDDIRRPNDDTWECVRTNDEAIRLLRTGFVEAISIDHDICCQVGNINHSSNETYMPVVYYILAMPREIRPKVVKIHTGNTYAGNYMIELLTNQVDRLERDWTFGNPQNNREI